MAANAAVDQARELARHLAGMLCHVNLIPLNDVPERICVPQPPRKWPAFDRRSKTQAFPLLSGGKWGGYLRRLRAAACPIPEESRGTHVEGDIPMIALGRTDPAKYAPKAIRTRCWRQRGPMLCLL